MAVKLPLPDKEEFKKNVEKFPNPELAKMYGVDASTISKWRLEFGVANVWKKQAVDWEQFRKDASTMWNKELMEKYNVSSSTACLWRQQQGVAPGKKLNKPIAWTVDGNGCWICTSHKLSSNGYPQGSVRKGRRLIAQVVWCEKNGEWPEGKHLLHNCDNSVCINPEHVMPGTQQMNQKDMARRSRSCWGERNGIRKLTPDQAKKIFALKGTLSQRKVGEKFGVSGATVFHIWNGSTWWRDTSTNIDNFPVKLTKHIVGKKLKWDQVQSIRSMQGKMSSTKVAKVFRVSQPTVVKIWNRKTWNDEVQ